MLELLHLAGVGPADELVFGPLAERLNLVTGDNGLGKSFLLDLSWWALTGSWSSYPAVPRRPDASIRFALRGASGPSREVSRWVPAAQGWKRKAGPPANDALVIYVRADGSFAVFDPAKSYRPYQAADGSTREIQPAFRFGPGAVLDELRSPDGQVVCRGLIDDWTRWQAAGDPRFAVLTKILAALSDDSQPPIVAGTPARPFLGDVRDIPTIKTAYGHEVPVILASAGMRRVLELAYLLTWAFSEHEEAARKLGLGLAEDAILLVDEPESHLHPRWQRQVLAGLLDAVASWRAPAPRVQVIAATYSPLVLVSLEPIFDTARDALWKLDLAGSTVRLTKDAWRKRGDANRWLTSDVIGLGMATSPEAEAALHEASRLLREPSPDPAEIARVDAELARLLPEMDPFLVRWRHYRDQHLGAGP
jgi:hypothetical protein